MITERTKKIFGNISGKLWDDWHWQLKNRITDPKIAGIEDDCRGRFAVTPHYFNLIRRFDQSDPIYRQIVPIDADYASYTRKDPFDEESHMPVSGLIVRYPDRGLVVTTDFCYTYCQFCTRKWRWGKSGEQITISRFEKIAEYLENHSHIRELIFSGGDALTLNDETIERMLSITRSIKSIKVIRIATRVPAFMPQRITENLSSIIKKFSPIWIMTHFNHPRELTHESSRATAALRFAGVSLLNQSVLLKGVNDNYNTLYELFSKLQEFGIKPYYLFSCDPVYGTEKFKVPIEQGIEFIERLVKELGGIAIPRYIADVPGRSKLHIAPLRQIET